MEILISRWQKAGERASTEQVRILKFDDIYVATSTSRQLGYYRLSQTADGWACECIANTEYHLPCKHLWALSDVLQLDLLGDMRVDWPQQERVATAA